MRGRCDSVKRHVGLTLGLLITEVGLAQVPGYAELDGHSSERPTTRRSGDGRPPPGPMDEPLVTDRPDFTESTEAVPAGHFQLEAGYTFTLDSEGKARARAHSVPELLLRIGVVEGFELRIGWDGYSWTDEQFEGRTRGGRRVPRTDWSQGGHDMSLGFKHKLIEQDGLLPHFGVIGAITIPSGSTGISSGGVSFSSQRSPSF